MMWNGSIKGVQNILTEELPVGEKGPLIVKTKFLDSWVKL